MKFIRIQAKGCLNSFRRPDFQTYHKTFPLPLKTTVGGMLGSALGVPPEKVNSDWLTNNRFMMGIIGKNGGEAKDLWQIRKYEGKQIKAYNDRKENAPYKTAVIVRELLYAMNFTIYFSFKDDADYDFVLKKIENPAWAISLGREDELIKLIAVKIIDLEEKDGLFYKNTVLPVDLSTSKYEIKLNENELESCDILKDAPRIVKVPISFIYNEDTLERNALNFSIFSFVGNIPVKAEGYGYNDEELNYSFQTF